VGQAQTRWVARADAMYHVVWNRVSGLLKQVCTKLRARYGTRYAHTILAAVFFTCWLPIPGSSLVAVALVMVVAEAQRAFARSSGFAGAIPHLVARGKANVPF
jgi:hypothetical protein